MKTRIIHTRIWEDEFFGGLNSKNKLLFIYLLTNHRIGMTGVYECSDRLISFDTGISIEDINSGKEILKNKFVFYKGWIVILNCGKYNNYTSNDFMKKAYQKERESLPEDLKKYVPFIESKPYANEYVSGTNTNYKHRDIVEKVLGRKLEPFEVVHHIDKNPQNNNVVNLAVTDKKTHTLIHKGEIDINDSKVILVSDYYNTSSTPIKTINNKEKTINKGVVKGKHSSIKNITEQDILEIAERYKVSVGFVKLKLETLRNYCESKGKRYKNYKSALRNFVLGDIQKNIERGQNDTKRGVDARNIK